MDIEEIKKDLEQSLTEKRYIHSVGTMKAARELAALYGEDEEKAAFAGLIHDVAKELSKEEIEQFANLHKIEMDEIEKNQLGLMHAKLGAFIAKERYQADKQVQNAILYHTTGNTKMDTFAKIIYIADKIEENRDYDGVEELRELAKKDLDKTILIMIDRVLEKAINKQKLIHPDTVNLRNYIIINQIN